MGAGCTKLALSAYGGAGWHESGCAAQAARIADGWWYGNLPLHLALQQKASEGVVQQLLAAHPEVSHGCWLHQARPACLGEITTAWVSISMTCGRVLCYCSSVRQSADGRVPCICCHASYKYILDA